MSPNTPRNSFDPKKDLGLTIFLTGLGGLEFTNRPDGVPWTFNGNDNLVPQLATSVTLGAPGLTASAAGLQLSYLGPAPGKVAVDQANVLGQWQGWPQGCRVPLSLALLAPQVEDDGPGSFAPFSYTQLVNVSIQPGGGVCAEPTDSGLGLITWQKRPVSDVGETSSTEAITAQFIESDGLGFPQPGPFPQPQSRAVIGPFASPPPACNASLPNTLDAGALTVSGPGLNSVALQPTNLQPGTQLERPCQASLRGPYPCSGGYVFNWTGGDDRSIVTIQFLVGNTFQAVASEYAQFGTGGIGIPESYGPYPSECEDFFAFPFGTCSFLPEGTVEVIITQTPPSAPSQPFKASGLGWGGAASWKYVWDFRGLTN